METASEEGVADCESVYTKHQTTITPSQKPVANSIAQNRPRSSLRNPQLEPSSPTSPPTLWSLVRRLDQFVSLTTAFGQSRNHVRPHPYTSPPTSPFQRPSGARWTTSGGSNFSSPPGRAAGRSRRSGRRRGRCCRFDAPGRDYARAAWAAGDASELASEGGGGAARLELEGCQNDAAEQGRVHWVIKVQGEPLILVLRVHGRPQ